MINRKNINIIIIENSHIICEGISVFLTKTGFPFTVHFVDSFTKLQQIKAKIRVDLIFINPHFIQNQIKFFHTLKDEFEESLWVGIVYSYYNNQQLALLDEIIFIDDAPEKITATIRNLIVRQQSKTKTTQHETLSNREIDVLRLLVAGKSNKEIAQELHISTSTVISHRKNITSKTQIKSVAGLTIYAIVHKFISINDYHPTFT